MYRVRAGTRPAASDMFIGRELEIKKITTLLLGSARLVTLTGPGGIGKTRLAAEIARRCDEDAHTSVYWVRLARLPVGADAGAVEMEVARSVLDADPAVRPTWDELVDKLTCADEAGQTPRTLVVLDNCEHVLASAA
ncbi:ATP-binding protein, partial [Nocardia sp. NPDC004568]|uniref:ATP-binding protein n=1 Tax=Nocardia sp. NPDC004568 TaxID=3154551 RepID=UPI0033B3E87D